MEPDASNLFKIDPNSGQIALAHSLVEFAGRHLGFIVEAKDGGLDGSGLNNTAKVAIHVEGNGMGTNGNQKRKEKEKEDEKAEQQGAQQQQQQNAKTIGQPAETETIGLEGAKRRGLCCSRDLIKFENVCMQIKCNQPFSLKGQFQERLGRKGQHMWGLSHFLERSRMNNSWNWKGWREQSGGHGRNNPRLKIGPTTVKTTTASSPNQQGGQQRRPSSPLAAHPIRPPDGIHFGHSQFNASVMEGMRPPIFVLALEVLAQRPPTLVVG
jgi:hypothetical protein